jgi:hypothetical protein
MDALVSLMQVYLDHLGTARKVRKFIVPLPHRFLEHESTHRIHHQLISATPFLHIPRRIARATLD